MDYNGELVTQMHSIMKEWNALKRVQMVQLQVCNVQVTDISPGKQTDTPKLQNSNALLLFDSLFALIIYSTYLFI